MTATIAQHLAAVRRYSALSHGLAGLRRFCENPRPLAVSLSEFYAESFTEKTGKLTVEQQQEQAELIADILYRLYGDQAMEYVQAATETGKVKAAAKKAGAVKHSEDFDSFAEGGGWRSEDHPRGKNGRWIPKGSSEAAATAKEVVGKVLKGGEHAAGVAPDDVAKHLAILTVKQLRELHKEHGRSIPGNLREQLVEAVKSRLAPASGKDGIGHARAADELRANPSAENLLRAAQEHQKAGRSANEFYGHVQGAYGTGKAGQEKLQQHVKELGAGDVGEVFDRSHELKAPEKAGVGDKAAAEEETRRRESAAKEKAEQEARAKAEQEVAQRKRDEDKQRANDLVDEYANKVQAHITPAHLEAFQGTKKQRHQVILDLATSLDVGQEFAEKVLQRVVDKKAGAEVKAPEGKPSEVGKPAETKPAMVTANSLISSSHEMLPQFRKELEGVANQRPGDEEFSRKRWLVDQARNHVKDLSEDDFVSLMGNEGRKDMARGNAVKLVMGIAGLKGAKGKKQSEEALANLDVTRTTNQTYRGGVNVPGGFVPSTGVTQTAAFLPSQDVYRVAHQVANGKELAKPASESKPVPAARPAAASSAAAPATTPPPEKKPANNLPAASVSAAYLSKKLADAGIPLDVQSIVPGQVKYIDHKGKEAPRTIAQFDPLSGNLTLVKSPHLSEQEQTEAAAHELVHALDRKIGGGQFKPATKQPGTELHQLAQDALNTPGWQDWLVGLGYREHELPEEAVTYLANRLVAQKMGNPRPAHAVDALLPRLEGILKEQAGKPEPEKKTAASRSPSKEKKPATRAAGAGSGANVRIVQLYHAAAHHNLSDARLAKELEAVDRLSPAEAQATFAAMGQSRKLSGAESKKEIKRIIFTRRASYQRGLIMDAGFPENHQQYMAGQLAADIHDGTTDRKAAEAKLAHQFLSQETGKIDLAEAATRLHIPYSKSNPDHPALARKVTAKLMDQAMAEHQHPLEKTGTTRQVSSSSSPVAAVHAAIAQGGGLGGSGLIPMHKIRERLATAGITDRAAQDRAIQDARKSGGVTASPKDTQRTSEEQAGAFRDPGTGETFHYLERRPGAGATPAPEPKPANNLPGKNSGNSVSPSVDNGDQSATTPSSGTQGESHAPKSQVGKPGEKTMAIRGKSGQMAPHIAVGQVVRYEDGTHHVVTRILRGDYDEDTDTRTTRIAARPATEAEVRASEKKAKIDDLKQQISSRAVGPDDEQNRSAFETETRRLDAELQRLEGRPIAEEEEKAKKAQASDKWTNATVPERVWQLPRRAAEAGGKQLSIDQLKVAAGISDARWDAITDNDAMPTDEEIRRLAAASGISEHQIRHGR